MLFSVSKPDIFSYDLPLKEPLPCFYYDLALYCDCLKQVITAPMPPYLRELSERVDAYASQAKKCKPKEFPEPYRVYLVDYRLNFLFACLDETGKIATYFSRYGKRAHDLTDAYYGDGSLIGDVFPGGTYDLQEMLNFTLHYGFLPVEELAAPAALVYDNDQLVERRILSQYQLCLLMEKFRSKNLVDWKRLIRDAKDYCPC